MAIKGRILSQQDMGDILLGGAFLGSGGGGPLGMSREVLAAILAEEPSGSRVLLCDPGWIAREAWYGVVAFFGSPTAATQQATSDYRALDRAFQALAAAKGVTLAGVVPVEVGAVNSLAPMLVGCRAGLPVIDADGAGRAVPSLEVLTFAEGTSLSDGRRLPIAPVIYTAEDGTCIEVTAQYPQQVEAVGISIAAGAAFGGLGAMAMWAMRGMDLRRVGVPGGISRAQRIGAAWRTASSTGADPVAAILAALDGDGGVLFRGKLVEIQQSSASGLDLGRIRFHSEDHVGLTIYDQNENLFAYRSDGGAPVIMGPDLICYLGPDGPCSNAELVGAGGASPYAGQPFTIIGVKAPRKLREPGMIERFLRHCRPLGYAGPYLQFQPSSPA
ncbi:MAG: DUF917 domain-containing protein [Pseudomonadota bacterium]